MNRAIGRRCRMCGEPATARDRHGSVCRACKPARVWAQPKPSPKPSALDLVTAYKPGTIPSPFLFEQLRKEARRAVGGGPSEDLIQHESWKRRVFAVFVRRCRDLGIPMEGT